MPAWLAAISHFLVDEALAPNPGSSLMISRLIDLLVIRALRSWAATQTRRTGWLAGLGEERISRASSAMHADPFRRWTVNDLAKVALMSRSIFRYKRPILRNSRGQMRFALKAVAVVVLTFLIAKLGYSWTWLENWFNSPEGSRAYLAVANLFDVNGPEQGDTLVMCVFLAVSFVLSIVVVGLAGRYNVTPARRIVGQTARTQGRDIDGSRAIGEPPSGGFCAPGS